MPKGEKERGSLGWVNEPTAGFSLSSSSSSVSPHSSASPAASPGHKKGVDRALPGGSTWSPGVTTVSQLSLQARRNNYWQVSWHSGRVAMGLNPCSQQSALSLQTHQRAAWLSLIFTHHFPEITIPSHHFFAPMPAGLVLPWPAKAFLSLTVQKFQP